jgi:predicted kinase
MSPAGPTLLVISGLPGSGKSTLAAWVVARWPTVTCSVDPIESAMAEAGIDPGFEGGLAAYLVAARIAEATLRAGLDAIVDAVSSVDPARTLWRSVAERSGSTLRVVVCEVDPAIQPTRLASRDRGLTCGEPTLADVEARRAEWSEWPETVLCVDTAAGATACVDAVARFLREP